MEAITYIGLAILFWVLMSAAFFFGSWWASREMIAEIERVRRESWNAGYAACSDEVQYEDN